LQVVLRERWSAGREEDDRLEVVLREERTGRDRANGGESSASPLDLTVPLLRGDLLADALSPDLMP
jgi:hypothetical protein